MVSSSLIDVFDHVHDVVVVGSGYAGFAAAMRLVETGQDVLLIGPRGDLLWESGRAFAADAGDSDDSGWRALVDAVTARGGAADGWIDGAITEVVATQRLLDAGLSVLYYAQPVAVERDGSGVSSLIVATKAGLRRVAARRYVDATEEATLLRLMGRNAGLAAPERREATLCFQHADWVEDDGLLKTAWPTERLLRVELEDDEDLFPTVERALQSLPGSACDAVMSHCSVEAYNVYAPAEKAVAVYDNVAVAVPGLADRPVETLADRYGLGVRAAERVSAIPASDPHADVLERPLPAVVPGRRIETSVLVAGGGTGGALAAIAAGRAGARTLCIEPMTFAGGIGSGGGIHSYYHGVTGGLQEEIDQAVRSLMKSAGPPLSGGPFNPEAKKIVLERMMLEAGVTWMPGTLLYAVETEGGRVVRACAATPEGPVELTADAWIDATGDGDLCAMAGAEFALGRHGDGLPHAYSQSSGQLRQKDGGKPTMRIVNFDAGWCDPTDPVDLTRARLVAIAQYLKPRYQNLNRPTYIAPAIGLRQARQIVTDHVLTLADQIERRRFDDAIGLTGCHYDNHAVDYEFESDEAVFWVWGNRAWRSPFACEISYRMLLPRGLDNVWIACRALGVSQDAHHSLRMQRDMQRIGEAAGYAAALCVEAGVGARDVPFTTLRRLLEQTGAIGLAGDDTTPLFPEAWGGKTAQPTWFDTPAGAAHLEEDLAALKRGEPGESSWRLYRAGDRVRERVAECLDAQDPMVSWLAAGVCAIWGDARAEPRLLQAIDHREDGFEDAPEAKAPGNNNRVVHHWLVAIVLLRCCGTAEAIPALERLARDGSLMRNARTSIALTIERLAGRGQVGDPVRAEALLDGLVADIPPDVYVAPQNPINSGPQEGPGNWDTREDHTWQLHLAVGRARAALGLPLHAEALPYTKDPRVLVRRAFERVIGQPGPLALVSA